VLDPEIKDAYGIAGAKIEYKLSENSRRLVEFHQARARESLLAAGARDVVVAPFIRATGWHLLGTTMMGEDPATSVVDHFGESHELPGLYALGGGQFPTYGAYNPTVTIMALAYMTADRVLETAGAAAAAHG
jgi:choline dehydrogenase-like flavoprotein